VCLGEHFAIISAVLVTILVLHVVGCSASHKVLEVSSRIVSSVTDAAFTATPAADPYDLRTYIATHKLSLPPTPREVFDISNCARVH